MRHAPRRSTGQECWRWRRVVWRRAMAVRVESPVLIAPDCYRREQKLRHCFLPDGVLVRHRMRVIRPPKGNAATWERRTLARFGGRCPRRGIPPPTPSPILSTLRSARASGCASRVRDADGVARHAPVRAAIVPWRPQAYARVFNVL